ncbi:MAG: type III pantothenate kinase [Chloroflexota bacterium]
MIVAIDVGNTKISLGIIKGGDVASAHRASTRTVADAGDAERVLGKLLAHDDAALSDVSEAWLSSVVPTATDAIAEVCQRYSIALTVAGSANVPMELRVPAAESVGQDRLMDAFAAAQLFEPPLIVVDLGTATTFNAVAADGAFIGGAIAPGLGLGLDALAEKTAQLPRVPITRPAKAVGGDTVSAIMSGALIGYRGLVREVLEAMSQEMTADGSDRPKVILTGGLSTSDWAQTIAGVDAVEPLLVLRGLALLKREMMALPKVAHT